LHLRARNKVRMDVKASGRGRVAFWQALYQT
jgi:hypothetical protein